MTISINYVFNTQNGPIPLSELDINFTTLINAINAIITGDTPVGNANLAGGLSNVLSPLFGGTGLAVDAALDGQLLIGSTTSGVYDLANLTQGFGTTIINGSNSITISSISTPNSTTSASTISPSFNAAQYNVTALSVSTTIAIPTGTGTKVDGQPLTIRIKDNGTARALTWTTTSGGFRALGVTLPTTTVANTPKYIRCLYNSQDSYWDVIAIN